MKRMILTAATLGMIALTQVGCMSAIAINRRFHHEGEGAYFGTRAEGEVVHAIWNGEGWFQKSRPKAVLVALDVPFTVISDTVLLPFDLTVFHPARRTREDKTEGSNNASQPTK